MRKVINTDPQLCVGCNRCTRACPIETANITYQDENDDIKVRVDNSHCIACGRCLEVCKHNARYYTDDTATFFNDLNNGEPISIIVAPSIRTNIPQWKRLFTYLKSLGVRLIYDVSLGADICIWAHLQHLDAHKDKKLVTQPCAAIVSYCEKHCPDLLSSLSPIHSPMACTAIYMRKYKSHNEKIAAISPCIAKSNEFYDTGVIDYNVTYTKLLEYLERNNIALPECETGFDHSESGLGVLFPLPGGLKENLEHFLGKTIRIDRFEGHDVYNALEVYLRTPKDILPTIFDVLNCEGGCNVGSACMREHSLFEIEAIMSKARNTAKPDSKPCAEMLDINDFMRTYAELETQRYHVSDHDINKAFELLGKDTFVKQNFNCGACGSNTCRDMARKIALNLNLPVNCVIKSRDDAKRDHEQNIMLAEQNAEYIELIHDIGYNLSSMDKNDYNEVITSSLKTLCLTLREKSLCIWRRVTDGGKMRYKRLYYWSVFNDELAEYLDEDLLPDVFEQLKSGSPVTRVYSSMTEHEKRVFDELKITSSCAVPIMLRGEFWGFTSINNDNEQSYSDQLKSLVASVSMLIVSSLVEHELTENLIAAREEALHNSKAKSDFLSRMSHEMRTPMNAIIGMTKIAETTQDMSRLQHCISSIGNSSMHLLGLINDTLDMSKIEAGKFELNHVPFNLRRVLKKTSDLLLDAAQKKNMKFEILLDESLPLDFVGDDLRLSQVITNVLSNAVKFTPDNGNVSLKVEYSHITNDHCVVKFIVTDTGIGMTEEQIKRLFTSFEQVDGSITRRFGGTGLGLAISKNLIEKMGGSISVASQVGVGSTFTITVRLERADHYQVQASKGTVVDSKTETPDFSGITMLLAEDIEINREILITLLDDTGISIDVSENGIQAVEKYTQNPEKYDLIIMDIQMPDMDGIEATKRIRALGGKAQEIPIIAMTANAFREDVEKCLESGMNDHLAKPIDVGMVRTKIMKYAKSYNERKTLC